MASEEYVGVQIFMGIENDSLVEVQFEEDNLFELILSPVNLNESYRQVVRNGGARGVDKMGTGELLLFLTLHKDELLEQLRSERYRPNPVRRVEIPKENRKKCQLGIPTVVDCFVQQTISQVLRPLYEPQFSDNSFGFRPVRSAHDALCRVQGYADQGYRYCIGLDLEKFLDRVNHSKLIELLSCIVKESRVVSLISKYLNAGVMVGHKYEAIQESVPQDSSLSPILGNILLNKLDKELERSGHPFVSYADDCLIMVKSLRATERVRDSISEFVEKKLFLKVNKDKTEIGSLSGKKYLGYSFY